jgi:hypothetical protein
MDLVREILLAVEDDVHSFGSGTDDGRLAAYPDEQVLYHVELLEQAALLAGVSVLTGAVCRVQTLTWQGHDFLDTVRDPEVWTRTKDGASRMGGWTFGLLKDIGAAYLKHIAKERLGLDL